MTLTGRDHRWAFWGLFSLAVGLVMTNFLARFIGAGILVSIFNFSVLAVFLLLIARDIGNGKISKFIILWFVFIVTFVLLSELGGLAKGLSVSVFAALLLGKIFIVLFLLKGLRVSVLSPVVFALTLIHLVGVGLNFAFPNLFISLMTETSFEADTTRAMGFLLNANRAAAISAVLALFYWFIERRYVLFLILLTVLLLTVSRSFLFFFVFAFLYFSLLNGEVHKRLFIGLLIAIPILYYVVEFGGLEDTLFKIEETVYGDLKYIRAAMLIGGVALAREFFPFGAGGGTFGSTLSRGSGVYDYLGIGDWETVIDATGIFDSGVGALLGEYGVIGFLMVFLMIGVGFRLFGGRVASIFDIIFIVAIIIYLSFFRTIFADFFYSFIVTVLFVMLCHIKLQGEKLNARSSRP